jgi:putative sterol carrier protein
MSTILTEAVAALNEKLGAGGFDGSAKFAIKDEGAIIIDGSGAHISDDDADVTLTASAETFRNILSGNQNATAAFMMGKLKVDGDMGMAMRLAGVIA